MFSGFDYDVTLFLSSLVVGLFCYKLLVYFLNESGAGRLYKASSCSFLEKHKDSSFYRVIHEILQVDKRSVTFETIGDRFDNLSDLGRAIKQAGLESSNVILGIDFTASNEWQGRKSFDRQSLHFLSKSSRKLNPYQKVISAIGGTLDSFDDDKQIPVFGFGDKVTKDKDVFPFKKEGTPCQGFNDVLQQYTEVVKTVELSGPTSYAPVIRKSIDIVKEKQGYHILVIIADGQVVAEEDCATREAIVEASNYPLSIIVVGVGDGPWDLMHVYDEKLPMRQFDNFQFVNYHEVVKKTKNQDVAFALHALMEIPDQYKMIKQLGYINDIKCQDLVKEKTDQLSDEQIASYCQISN